MQSTLTQFLRDHLTGDPNQRGPIADVVALPVSERSTLSRTTRDLNQQFDKLEQLLVRHTRPSAQTPVQRAAEATVVRRKKAAVTSGSAGGTMTGMLGMLAGGLAAAGIQALTEGYGGLQQAASSAITHTVQSGRQLLGSAMDAAGRVFHATETLAVGSATATVKGLGAMWGELKTNAGAVADAEAIGISDTGRQAGEKSLHQDLQQPDEHADMPEGLGAIIAKSVSAFWGRAIETVKKWLFALFTVDDLLNGVTPGGASPGGGPAPATPGGNDGPGPSTATPRAVGTQPTTNTPRTPGGQTPRDRDNPGTPKDGSELGPLDSGVREVTGSEKGADLESRGIVNKNLGNMADGPFARAHGAIGSAGRDTGHGVAVFPDFATGAAATEALARLKYVKGGHHTINDIIAGGGKWTPGNYGAAANIARHMGISPNEDAHLDDPKQLAKFRDALSVQELGAPEAAYAHRRMREEKAAREAANPGVTFKDSKPEDKDDATAKSDDDGPNKKPNATSTTDDDVAPKPATTEKRDADDQLRDDQQDGKTQDVPAVPPPDIPKKNLTPRHIHDAGAGMLVIGSHAYT